MDFFINYWFVIFGILVFFAMCIYSAYHLFNMPTEKQLETLREWLKYAVSVAENELGGGTGQLKLRNGIRYGNREILLGFKNLYL